ncbi:hypothetical protein D3C73_1307000 [compost metagenome]
MHIFDNPLHFKGNGIILILSPPVLGDGDQQLLKQGLRSKLITRKLSIPAVHHLRKALFNLVIIPQLLRRLQGYTLLIAGKAPLLLFQLHSYKAEMYREKSSRLFRILSQRMRNPRGEIE